MSKQREDRNARSVPSYSVSKIVRLTVALVLFSCWTGASAAEVRANEDPDLLLQRIRGKIADHLSRLRNYTCHVAIDRVERALSSSHLDRRDSVELDVAFVGDRELFSLPGQAQFAEQPISQIVPDGMIGNDAFGAHDDDVFLEAGPTFKYAGSCKRDGHNTFRYNFRVPLETKRLWVRHGGSADATVAYQGSFWVDAETLDMVRLKWKTDHIPPSVGISSIDKSMRYEVVHVGNSDFVLPLHSELTSFDREGNYRWNTMTLKHCQEFSGGSTVTYGAPVGDAAAHSQPRPR
jgi:hypothetical protein